MSDETEAAARVAQVASQAADALTKTAAHTAAAVVEVAAEAHASMAPSVLVVTMFGTLERQLEHLSKQVTEIHEWKDRFERRADGRHGNLDTMVGALVKKVEIQNGGVTRALDWQNAHETRRAAAAQVEQGRREQRSDDLAVVRGVQTFLSDSWPLILGLILGATGIVAFMWDRWPL